jgi:hypothetical protein
MRPSYKRYVRGERERYQREGLNITYPRRRKPEIIYKDRVKEVEKIIVQEKIVYKERPAQTEKKPETTYITRAPEAPTAGIEEFRV